MNNYSSGLGRCKDRNVSEDTFKAVAETLRTSTFLKVYEDGKKISRVTELAKPDEVIKQLEVKTIVTSPLEYCVKVELLWLCKFFVNYYAVQRICFG
ncbi:la protein 1-like isoform X2 [Olea europaea var. sylvestris]|uniref:la protein 1-like isoform X2 n=1 Tax=Olea europaea var. sylvestris TaxID=158386 RepID=UPI000C1D8020|nr:la protein 1-like isoform X2 [Olea europaea var. sylvestris]